MVVDYSPTIIRRHGIAKVCQDHGDVDLRLQALTWLTFVAPLPGELMS